MSVKIHSTMGYLSMDVWILANIIQLGTQEFCQRFVTYKTDPCGRQYDQMTQAARSGVANIAEGSSRHQTSRETEMKLIDVARASMAELLGDYYNYLLSHGYLPMSKESDVANLIFNGPLDKAIYQSDWLRESAEHILRQKSKFDIYLHNSTDETMANALMFLCLRAINQLKALIAFRLEEFKKEGGFAENMTEERIAAKVKQAGSESPTCPKCGSPMIKRFAKRGINSGKPFWSCSQYPNCTGTRNV